MGHALTGEKYNILNLPDLKGQAVPHAAAATTDLLRATMATTMRQLCP